MKRLAGVLAFVVSMICANAFGAVPANISVVDLQKIMQTSNQMKEIQKKVDEEFKPRRDKLMEMDASLKADMEKFKRESAVMSAVDKKNLEKKIISEQQQLERDGQQYQQDFTTANNDAMEKLYAKVRDAIRKVANDDHYDLIIQKDAAPFSVEALDVTDKVVKAIG
jgi:outer membrane protein